MRVSADISKCQGHGLCAVISERLFPLDDDGHTTLEHWTNVATDDVQTVVQAQVACPENAIRVEATT